MTWIIDGYNLLFAHPRHKRTVEQRDLKTARRDLLRELAGFATKRGEIEVVFDGRRDAGPLSETRPPLRTIFSRGPQSADDCIVDRLHAIRRKCRVVTNDRGLAQRLRDLEVEVVSVEEFLEVMLGRSRPWAKAREDEEDEAYLRRIHRPEPWEIDYWMQEFGFDEDESV